MKKLSIFILALMVLSCNRATLIEPLVDLTCDDTSVFEYSNGLKYTFDKNNIVVALEQKTKPVINTYDFKYDRTRLIFSDKNISANFEQSRSIALNEKGAIKSYEDNSGETLKKGVYEYDGDNRLMKISVTYSSIDNPNLFQIHYQVLKWENDNIVTMSYYFKYGNESEKLQKAINFKYGNTEILDKDNFYNLAFFDSPNINIGGLLYLDYLGLNKGKAPKNIPVKYTIIDNSGQIADRGVGEYSYQMDKFNRISNIKISNNANQSVVKSFNYLCH